MKKLLFVLSAVFLLSFIDRRTTIGSFKTQQKQSVFLPKSYTFYVLNSYPMGGNCTAFISGSVTFTWDSDKPKDRPVVTGHTLTLNWSGTDCHTLEARTLSINQLGWDEYLGKFNDITFNSTGDSIIDNLLSDITTRQSIVDELNSQF